MFTMFHKYTHTPHLPSNTNTSMLTQHTQYLFIIKPANALATFYFACDCKLKLSHLHFLLPLVESGLTLVLSSSQRSSSSLPACPRLPISASLGFCGRMSAGTDKSSSHADSKGRARRHSFYVCLFNMYAILFNSQTVCQIEL